MLISKLPQLTVEFVFTAIINPLTVAGCNPMPGGFQSLVESVMSLSYVLLIWLATM